MAKLTPEDRENYNNLKEAFSQRSVLLEATDLTLKALVPLIDIEKIPTNTDFLHQKIDSLDLYLKVLEIQKTSLDFNPTNKSNPDEKKKLNQHFFDSLRELKRSLKVVEDENLDLTDEVESFRSDTLILEFLPKTDDNYELAKQSTEKLLNNQDPNFSEKQINKLIQAWEIAISKFVEDARKPKPIENSAVVESKRKLGSGGQVEPGQPDTFAHFFRIHKELEILYGRLADTEAIQLSK